ncbi:hypothetical protein CYLTODRAFT_393694 [Cylindrobasidium torrendii FP15055 ss-10]|uniref:GmrSD restriction endonucleases N-terminal domain-containing protein n=1 Tax=Cylindrobasidium torrendii FP15055 ss-10 TaxID=1314674 RepID=A0A0D7BIN6_9AGAR|nr:hypothetical protein CYLTODRAFT_393694 [Cylindrobasidium torrendii FP15055 ss-10]
MDTDSEMSDLSSLSESEAEYAAPKKKAPKKKKETHALDKPALRPPRASNYSLASIYHDLTQGYIDLEPEYQRAEVWSENKQMALLDSLLNNYYVPPIILAVEGPQNKRCIDGKQRMTSIQNTTNQKLWWKSTRSSVKILDEKTRTRFEMLQIFCVEYDSISEDQEREIFQRVQNGMPLTPQERLQAYNGEYPSFIREVQHILEDAEITNDIQWDTTRGKSFSSVAQIIYLVKEDNSKHAPSEPGTGKLEKWLSNANDPVPANIRDQVKRTVNVYTTLIHTQGLKESLGSGKHARLSPIEFVLFGYMIFVHKDSLSLVQLSSAIDMIRTRLKAAYQDRRFNTRQYKWFLAEIAKVCGKPDKLKSDGKGDKSADSQVRAIKAKEEKAKAKVAQAKAAKKEKEAPKEMPKAKAKVRPLLDSSDMEEDTPPPKKTPAKAPAKTNKRKRLLSSDSDSDDVPLPKIVLKLKKPVVNSQMAKRTKPTPASVPADNSATSSAPSKLTARRPRMSTDMDTGSSTQVKDPPTTVETPIEKSAVPAPDSPVLLGPSLSRTPHSRSPVVRVKPEPKDDDSAMLNAMKDPPSAPIATPTTGGTPAPGMSMDPNVLAMMQWAAWYASQQPQTMAGYVPGQTPMAGQYTGMGQYPMAGQYPGMSQTQNIGHPAHAQPAPNPQMAPPAPPRMPASGQTTVPQTQPPAGQVLPTPTTGQGSAPGQASFGRPLAPLASNGSLPPRPTTNQQPSAPPPFFSNPPPNFPRRPSFDLPSTPAKRALSDYASPPASAPADLRNAPLAPRSMRAAESISTPYRRPSPDYGPVKPEPMDDPQGWNALPMPPPRRQPDSGWPKRGRTRSRSRDRGRNGDASSSRRRSPSRGRKSSKSRRSRSRSMEYVRSRSRRASSPKYSGRGYSDRGSSPPPRRDKGSSGYRDRDKEKSPYRGKGSSSKYRRSGYGGRYDYD